MKRFIIITLTVAGALYAQTAVPDRTDRETKSQHRVKYDAKGYSKL